MNEGQQGHFSFYERAGRALHPSETVWGKLCDNMKKKNIENITGLAFSPVTEFKLHSYITEKKLSSAERFIHKA